MCLLASPLGIKAPIFLTSLMFLLLWLIKVSAYICVPDLGEIIRYYGSTCEYLKELNFYPYADSPRGVYIYMALLVIK